MFGRRSKPPPPPPAVLRQAMAQPGGKTMATTGPVMNYLSPSAALTPPEKVSKAPAISEAAMEAAKVGGPSAQQLKDMQNAPTSNPSLMSMLPTGRGPGMKAGGKVSSASTRADGIAQRGKTRGRVI